jgi:hypothetical protein
MVCVPAAAAERGGSFRRQGRIAAPCNLYLHAVTAASWPRDRTQSLLSEISDCNAASPSSFRLHSWRDGLVSSSYHARLGSFEHSYMKRHAAVLLYFLSCSVNATRSSSSSCGLSLPRRFWRWRLVSLHQPRRSVDILTAAVTQLVSAQSSAPTPYEDPDTGIIFDTWTSPSSDITFGFALPTDALEVDATEYIGYLVSDNRPWESS